MSTLQVTVKYAGTVVQTAMCPLVDGARFGADSDVLVGFPGTVVELEQHETGFWIHGCELVPGRPVVIDLGTTEVWFERALTRPHPAWQSWSHHVKLATVMAAATLLAAWLDGVQGTLNANPQIAHSIEALLFTTGEVAPNPSEAPAAETSLRPPVTYRP